MLVNRIASEQSMTNYDVKSNLSRISEPHAPVLQLTPYETFLRKYTSYFLVNNCQRCRSLICNGQSLFPQKEAQKHFAFNLALLAVDLQHYEEAANQFKDVYMTYASSAKIRPPAQRISGTNAVELEKFAMLNNLLITYILVIEQNEDKARLSELMSFLHEAKLMNVRYTQSTEELKLMKIAVYV